MAGFFSFFPFFCYSQDARGLQRKTLSAIPNLVTSVDVETGSSTLKEALGSGEEGYAAVLFTEAG